MWTPAYTCSMNKTEQLDNTGYRFIRNQIAQTGITPSLREIGRAVGYVSPRSVQLMLERLQKRELLSYSEGKITLNLERESLGSEQTIKIPLIGSVTCGSPSLAQQEVEAYLQVSTKIASPGHKYFLLRAIGESMNKSGINGGDIVLIRQQNNVDEGDKVVALIDDEATIKHFHREKNLVVLKPNSTDKEYKPILVSESLIIQGIVVGVFPKSILHD